MSTEKPTYEELEKAFREAVQHLDYCSYGNFSERADAGDKPERFPELIKRLDASTNAKPLDQPALEESIITLCKAVEEYLYAGFSTGEFIKVAESELPKISVYIDKSNPEKLCFIKVSEGAHPEIALSFENKAGEENSYGPNQRNRGPEAVLVEDPDDG